MDKLKYRITMFAVASLLLFIAISFYMASKNNTSSLATGKASQQNAPDPTPGNSPMHMTVVNPAKPAINTGPGQHPTTQAPDIAHPEGRTIPIPESHQMLFDIALLATTDDGETENNIQKLHEKLESEEEIPDWSYAMESKIEQILYSQPSIAEYSIQAITCRTSLCEILATSSVDAQASWQSLIQSIKREMIEYANHSNTMEFSSNDGEVLLAGYLSISPAPSTSLLDNIYSQPPADAEYDLPPADLTETASGNSSMPQPGVIEQPSHPLSIPESHQELFNRNITVPAYNGEQNITIGELHRRLESEEPDINWADAMQANIESFLYSHRLIANFKIVSIHCRSSLCEVLLTARNIEPFADLANIIIEMLEQDWCTTIPRSIGWQSPGGDLQEIIFIERG